jgi:hypothetical protein
MLDQSVSSTSKVLLTTKGTQSRLATEDAAARRTRYPSADRKKRNDALKTKRAILGMAVPGARFQNNTKSMTPRSKQLKKRDVVTINSVFSPTCSVRAPHPHRILLSSAGHHYKIPYRQVITECTNNLVVMSAGPFPEADIIN